MRVDLKAGAARTYTPAPARPGGRGWADTPATLPREELLVLPGRSPSMASGIVTLLTDFGYRDPYVGIMKGVMLGINPAVRLVDLTHQVPPQDVEAAAFCLAHSLDWFPQGTVHLVVVDPGVGGERRALAVRSRRHFYVAPDNGVLTLALRQDPLEEAREILPGDYTLETISQTFHGRDLFSPVAAHLSTRDHLPLDLGPRVERLVTLPTMDNRREGDRILTAVLHVDTFGNLITGLHRSEVRSDPRVVRVEGEEIPLCRSYGEVAVGQLLALWGSAGLLEVSVNRGSAADRLGAGRGTPVEVAVA